MDKQKAVGVAKIFVAVESTSGEIKLVKINLPVYDGDKTIKDIIGDLERGVDSAATQNKFIHIGTGLFKANKIAYIQSDTFERIVQN